MKTLLAAIFFFICAIDADAQTIQFEWDYQGNVSGWIVHRVNCESLTKYINRASLDPASSFDCFAVTAINESKLSNSEPLPAACSFVVADTASGTRPLYKIGGDEIGRVNSGTCCTDHSPDSLRSLSYRIVTNSAGLTGEAFCKSLQ